MFPTQVSQNDLDESSRGRDSSQLIMETQKDHNENAETTAAPALFWKQGLTAHWNQKENINTDAALTYEVNRALREWNVLRSVDYCAIAIDVKNGTVYLRGHITGASSKIRIENAIQSIRGVSGIKNNLVLDSELTLKIAASLATLEHTYECKFFADVLHGVVSLDGVVNDENVKLLAEKCVASHPSIRAVINNVRVSGTNPKSQSEPFLQPAIGAIIYFLDGVFGSVKQVIINPNNRRVIQVVVQGKFSDHELDLNMLTDNRAEILEKAILIPVNLIRYLTSSSGFLTIKSTDITYYKDFNPLSFSVPKFGWMSPYPYCLENVLFAVDSGDAANQITADNIPNWEGDGGKMIQRTEAKLALEFHQIVWQQAAG
jgi:osmotically-inducible protein OsmY